MIKSKEIPGWNEYLVNELGEIYSKRKKRFLNPSFTKGYLQVKLSINKIQKAYKVHRLVMLTFQGYSNLAINHKNGIKHDNRLENLEYCTNKENTIHGYANGLMNPPKGEKHHNHKLKTKEVIKIRKLYSKNRMSMIKISKLYNVNRKTISKIINRLTWKHV